MTTGTWIDTEMLVTLFDESSVACEQFRKLQAKLRALKHATEGKLVSIVVTSPLMGEGKTSCAVNLAVALAQEPGRRVLLVDCDLRKPRVHSYIQEPPPTGLLDVLQGKVSSKEATVTMPGDSLDIISLTSSGSSNGHAPHSLPIEQLKDLFKSLAPKYEFIVCDAPPLLPTADGVALVDICDGALIVVRAGLTPRPAAARALASIDKKKMIGFLLNAVPEARMGSYYYKYYGTEKRKKK